METPEYICSVCAKNWMNMITSVLETKFTAKIALMTKLSYAHGAMTGFLTPAM